MVDRVTADHPTVETLEATLGRHGGTHRPEIRLPQHDAVPPGEVIRVVLDGSEYRSEVGRRSDETPVLRGAYETPRLARNPGEGIDALASWVEDRDLDVGRTVLVDVVEPAFKIGLRAPGEGATYAITKTPDDSLASIAEDLENS